MNKKIIVLFSLFINSAQAMQEAIVQPEQRSVRSLKELALATIVAQGGQLQQFSQKITDTINTTPQINIAFEEVNAYLTQLSQQTQVPYIADSLDQPFFNLNGAAILEVIKNNPSTLEINTAGSIIFNPSLTMLVVEYIDTYNLEIFRIENNKIINPHNPTILKFDNTITSLTFNPSGTMLAVGSNDNLKIWYLKNNKITNLENPTIIKFSNEEVRSVIFNPSGTMLAVKATDSVKWIDNIVRVWSIENNKIINSDDPTILTFNKFVVPILFKTMLVIKSEDNTASIWDIKHNQISNPNNPKYLQINN